MKSVFSSAVIATLLTLSISGCRALKEPYRTFVPATVTSVEEIQTIDGQRVIVRVTSKYYSDHYAYSLESDGYSEWNFESEFRVSTDNNELPIAFDVVANVAWIVLPVKNNQCVRFGFPSEGLVFFRNEGKSWNVVPYDFVPPNLRVNLLQNRSEYENGSGMDIANCPYGGRSRNNGFICSLDEKGAMNFAPETTHPMTKNYGRTITPRIRQYLDRQIRDEYQNSRYISKIGADKSIKEVVEANLSPSRIANYQSCYYLNPPVDPDERRSILEYVETPPIAVQSTLIQTIDEVVEISDEQQQQLFASPKIHGSCTQMVRRNFSARISMENQSEFLEVAGVPSGTFKSPGIAERVELNLSGATRSIYIPIKGFSAARIGAMYCQPDRIFINFGGGGLDGNLVLEYDQNARLLRKWKIALPPELKEGHTLAELMVEKERISFKLVDFERAGYSQGKAVHAKLIRQYFIEATLQLPGIDSK